MTKMPKLKVRLTPRRVAIKVIDFMHSLRPDSYVAEPLRDLLNQMKQEILGQEKRCQQDLKQEAARHQAQATKEFVEFRRTHASFFRGAEAPRRVYLPTDDASSELYQGAEQEVLFLLFLYTTAICPFFRALEDYVLSHQTILAFTKLESVPHPGLFKDLIARHHCLSDCLEVVQKIESEYLGAPVLPKLIRETATNLLESTLHFLEPVNGGFLSEDLGTRLARRPEEAGRILQRLGALAPENMNPSIVPISEIRIREAQCNLFMRMLEYYDYLNMFARFH